jgi:hypothetical protein
VLSCFVLLQFIIVVLYLGRDNASDDDSGTHHHRKHKADHHHVENHNNNHEEDRKSARAKGGAENERNNKNVRKNHNNNYNNYNNNDNGHHHRHRREVEEEEAGQRAMVRRKNGGEKENKNRNPFRDIMVPFFAAVLSQLPVEECVRDLLCVCVMWQSSLSPLVQIRNFPLSLASLTTAKRLMKLGNRLASVMMVLPATSELETIFKV